MVEEDTEFITFDGDTVTKSDYREEIIDKYINAGLDGLTKVTDFTIGSEAYHLADIMASYLLEHREMIDNNYRMSMIHTAEGEFLDDYGDRVGVHRKGSTGATGTVTFTRLSDDTTNPIVIADGTQIATDDAISFIVDNDEEDITIASGQTSVTDVPIICEEEGAYTNVKADTITIITGDLGNIVKVTNPTDLTGGEDIEDDDEYRARILLSPYDVPMGTLDWYENLVATTSPTSETVHDIKGVKGETSLDDDITIIFNPVDRSRVVTRMDLNKYNEDNSIESTVTGVMTEARQDLIELFNMREYDIVGTTKGYHLAGFHYVLTPTNNETFYFAVLLKDNYSLNAEMKAKIIEKIILFNGSALISVEFNPSSIASIIENEVEGISSCRIVRKDNNDNYTEVVEPVSIADNEVYQINTTDLENRIKEMRFNLDITLED